MRFDLLEWFARMFVNTYRRWIDDRRDKRAFVVLFFPIDTYPPSRVLPHSISHILFGIKVSTGEHFVFKLSHFRFHPRRLTVAATERLFLDSPIQQVA